MSDSRRRTRLTECDIKYLKLIINRYRYYIHTHKNNIEHSGVMFSEYLYFIYKRFYLKSSLQIDVLLVLKHQKQFKSGRDLVSLLHKTQVPRKRRRRILLLN